MQDSDWSRLDTSIICSGEAVAGATRTAPELGQHPPRPTGRKVVKTASKFFPSVAKDGSQVLLALLAAAAGCALPPALLSLMPQNETIPRLAPPTTLPSGVAPTPGVLTTIPPLPLARFCTMAPEPSRTLPSDDRRPPKMSYST